MCQLPLHTITHCFILVRVPVMLTLTRPLLLAHLRLHMEKMLTTCPVINLRSSAMRQPRGMYLRIVSVKISYNNKTIATYAFLDQGSTLLCDQKLIDVLGISEVAMRLYCRPQLTLKVKNCLLVYFCIVN